MRHEDFLMLKSQVEEKKEAVQDKVISSTPLPRTQNLIRLKPLPYKIVTFFDWWLCSLVSEPLINFPCTVEPFTFKQLARATKNFGSTQRIDEGTCFKALLEDGRVLASEEEMVEIN